MFCVPWSLTLNNKKHPAFVFFAQVICGMRSYRYLNNYKFWNYFLSCHILVIFWNSFFGILVLKLMICSTTLCISCQYVNKVVMHNLSLKSSFFRRFYYCSYVSEFIYTCCKRNFITILFLLFFHLTHGKRDNLKKTIICFLNTFVSLTILKIDHWDFATEISWLLSINVNRNSFEFVFVYKV